MKRPPDICRVRHAGNPESELANVRVGPTKYECRTLIHEFFIMKGRAGATCEQASRELGVRYTTASARISELKAERWLVPTGKRQKTTGGSSAAILRAQTKAERDGVFTTPVQLDLLSAVSR